MGLGLSWTTTTMVGAIVNDNIVSLDYKLKDGDKIVIVSSLTVPGFISIVISISSNFSAGFPFWL